MDNSYSHFDHAKRGPWETNLSPEEEMRFRLWVLKEKIPFDFASKDPQDYDMRGFWKENPKYHHVENQHFPDTYKTPYHQSFSRESRYALPTAPFWRPRGKGFDLFHPQSGKILFKE